MSLEKPSEWPSITGERLRIAQPQGTASHSQTSFHIHSDVYNKTAGRVKGWQGCGEIRVFIYGQEECKMAKSLWKTI